MVSAKICVRICRCGGSRARGTPLGGGTRGAGRLCAGSPGFMRLKAEGPELCAPGSKLSPWGIGLELRSHCTRRLGWTIV